MIITHTTLIRASGGAAMAAGGIFTAVQLGHPKLTVAAVATTNVERRRARCVVQPGCPTG